MYYKVSERVLPDSRTKYDVTKCEGDIPRTSTARIEGGRSVIDRYFLNQKEAEKYAEIYNAAEQGDLEPLLAAANEGLEGGRIGKSKLKLAREAAGLTRAQLAELLQFYEQ